MVNVLPDFGSSICVILVQYYQMSQLGSWVGWALLVYPQVLVPELLHWVLLSNAASVVIRPVL